MWKKEDMPEPSPAPRVEAAPSYERVAPPKASGERATIGRSITINGQVSGDEDLLIQGRVDGSVNLKQHAVTVGAEGEVKADITARVITVEGRVEGNLSAAEQAILRGSARVEGNISAPRVILEDGARFRGGVDMGETSKRGGTAASAPQQPGSAETGRPTVAGVTAQTELEASDTRSASPGTKDGATPAAAKVGR